MAWNRLAVGIPLLLVAVVALAVFAFDPLAKFGLAGGEVRATSMV